MARDGSGTFSLLVSMSANESAGLNIISSAFDTMMDDVASAITDSIDRDGQSDPTGNLAMAGFRHTGVGSAAAANEYLRTDQYQQGNTVFASASTSATNAYGVSLVPAITTYTEGLTILFRPDETNTGSANLHADGVSAARLTKGANTTLASGDVVANGLYMAVYSSGNFKLTNSQLDSTATKSGLVELATTAEVSTGTDVARAITPAGLAAQEANAVQRGLVRLATTAEAIDASSTAEGERALTIGNLFDTAILSTSIAGGFTSTNPINMTFVRTGPIGHIAFTSFAATAAQALITFADPAPANFWPAATQFMTMHVHDGSGAAAGPVSAQPATIWQHTGIMQLEASGTMTISRVRGSAAAIGFTLTSAGNWGVGAQMKGIFPQVLTYMIGSA